MKYLKLIRLPNLLMVPFTMYLMRYGVIKPILEYGFSFSMGEQIELVLPSFYFFILVMINVFLGAGGYVINDYFDRKIDAINRPDKVVVDKEISRRKAIILHFVFDAIAIILAGIFSWYLRKPTVFILYVMIAGIFWLYSTTYKKQLLVGNVIVALGTATIPLQVGFFDVLALNRAYASELLLKNISFMPIIYWMAAFALFAFLINLIREIIKDLEDLEGDESYGCNTLPVVFGVQISKNVVLALIGIVLFFLAFFYFRYLHDSISMWYLLLMITAPLVLVAVLTIRAKVLGHYKRISLIIKIIMLLGVLYALIAYQLMEFLFKI
jgi:4-hydroxybenzoate polyprenyltransferase